MSLSGADDSNYVIHFLDLLFILSFLLFTYYIQLAFSSGTIYLKNIPKFTFACMRVSIVAMKQGHACVTRVYILCNNKLWWHAHMV